MFYIAVSNHDDHLRNHGFLLDNNSWILSPAYDTNASLDNVEHLSLNISLDSSLSSFELLRSTSEYYKISNSDSIEITKRISNIVRKNWHKIAKKNKIPSSQISRMQACFER